MCPDPVAMKTVLSAAFTPLGPILLKLINLSLLGDIYIVAPESWIVVLSAVESTVVLARASPTRWDEKA